MPCRAALELVIPSQRSFYIEVSSDSRDPRLLYPAPSRGWPGANPAPRRR